MNRHDAAKRIGCVAFVFTCTSLCAQVDSFRPLGHFLVPGGGSAEIISATPDGNLVVYSSAITRVIGLVDIQDPSAPELLAEIPVPGEPTSVAVSPDGEAVLVVLKTSSLVVGERPDITPGLLQAYALPGGELLGEVRLEPGPDSVSIAVIEGQTIAVIAIENEPIIVDKDRIRLDEDAPGSPGDISKRGLVQVVTIDWDDFEHSKVKNVFLPNQIQLARLGLDFSDDPQPEFIDIRGQLAAITLQENNGVAILDLSRPNRPTFRTIFTTDRVGNRAADLVEDQIIDFSGTYPGDIDEPHAGKRVPDGVAWNAAGTALFTADEGELDFTGGRGFSAWSPEGEFLWDDGGAIEALAVTRGQYPEDRSGAKGVEMEGITTAVFGDKEFVFVSSERGAFLAVYEISDPAAPELVQFLPTGIAPESVLALPQRGLILTSDEGDEGSGSISFFEGIAGDFEPDAARPTLVSDGLEQSFSALSGLVADAGDPDLLYSVPDSALVSVIYTIEVGGPLARVAHLVPVTIGGEQARYDLEGIDLDTTTTAPAEGAGFWLASEGNAAFGTEEYLPNLLVQVNAAGEVLAEVRLPAAIDPDLPAPPAATTGLVRSNGFEGLAVSANGSAVLAAIQRGFQGEPAVAGVAHTRIGRYDLAAQTWQFFLYPLDPTPAGATWVALSEITQLGDDRYAVIERDNNWGALAAVKRVYAFRLDGVQPFEGTVTAASDLTGKVIQKELLFDVRNDFVPFEKVEGLALTGSGAFWAVLDNDGGHFENRLIRVGQLNGG